MPGVRMVEGREGGRRRVWLDDGQSAGATAAKGEPAWQYGPCSLWEEMTRVFAEYETLGEPESGRFGLTVTRSGQHVWLDEPRNVIQEDR
jgi:hypothetical protein